MAVRVIKIRTIAEVYPHLSFEAEVKLSNGDIVYSNISVNDKGEKVTVESVEELHWTFSEPLTEFDWEHPDPFEYVLSKVDELEIRRALVVLWNQHPVFNNSREWIPCELDYKKLWDEHFNEYMQSHEDEDSARLFRAACDYCMEKLGLKASLSQNVSFCFEFTKTERKTTLVRVDAPSLAEAEKLIDAAWYAGVIKFDDAETEVEYGYQIDSDTCTEEGTFDSANFSDELIQWIDASVVNTGCYGAGSSACLNHCAACDKEV